MQPEKQDGTGGRDPGTGRWLPGVSGNREGRPRGADFRATVVAARGEANIDATLVRVFDRLTESALAGDVSASRLLLDRLCGPAGDDAPPVSLCVVTGVSRGEPG